MLSASLISALFPEHDPECVDHSWKEHKACEDNVDEQVHAAAGGQEHGNRWKEKGQQEHAEIATGALMLTPAFSLTLSTRHLVQLSCRRDLSR